MCDGVNCSMGLAHATVNPKEVKAPQASAQVCDYMHVMLFSSMHNYMLQLMKSKQPTTANVLHCLRASGCVPLNALIRRKYCQGMCKLYNILKNDSTTNKLLKSNLRGRDQERLLELDLHAQMFERYGYSVRGKSPLMQ